jgi:hypothetical protein
MKFRCPQDDSHELFERRRISYDVETMDRDGAAIDADGESWYPDEPVICSKCGAVAISTDNGSFVAATVVRGEGNDKKWVAYCPKSCDHQTFETTTVVNQVVLVDKHGDYLSTVDECSQIVSGPDRDNLWHCSECGEEARWRQE